MTLPRTLIIIPALNERDNILGVVDDILSHSDIPIEDILVVDDCSDDGMNDLLAEHGIPYLRFAHHLGIGAAVQAGYHYAERNGYDIAVQFDGDGQHPAESLSVLLEPLITGEADYTVGSRFVTKEGFQSSGARRAGIGFLSAVVRLMTGVTVRDVTSGMRAVNRDLIEVFTASYEQDYAEPVALVYAVRSGAKILEVPVKMRERQSGISSITIYRSMYYMLKVTLALLMTGRAPRKAAGTGGKAC